MASGEFYNPTMDMGVSSNKMTSDYTRLYKGYQEMFDKTGDANLGFARVTKDLTYEDWTYELYLCLREVCKYITFSSSGIVRDGIFKRLLMSSDIGLRIECSDSDLEDIVLYCGKAKYSLIKSNKMIDLASKILKVVQFNQKYKHIELIVIELGYLYICEPISHLGWSGDIGFGRYYYNFGKCYMAIKYPREIPGMYCLSDYYEPCILGKKFAKSIRTEVGWREFKNVDFEKYLRQVSEVIIRYLNYGYMQEIHGYTYMLISKGNDVIILDNITNKYSKKETLRWSMNKDGMAGLEGKFLNTFSSLIAPNNFPEVHSIRFDYSLTRMTGEICYYYRSSCESGAVDIKITRKESLR